MTTPLYRILNGETPIYRDSTNSPVRIPPKVSYRKNPFITEIVSESEDFESELDKSYDMFKALATDSYIQKAAELSENKNISENVKENKKRMLKSKCATIKIKLADFQYWLNPKNKDKSDYKMRLSRLMRHSPEINGLVYKALTEWPRQVYIKGDFDTSSFERLSDTFYNHVMLPKQLRAKHPVTDIRPSAPLMKLFNEENTIYFDEDRKKENIANPPRHAHSFVREMDDYLELWRKN